uniref:(northern house mosquito) hypothetical protein n=1 Tax=Culex pipiens TaxID=7175 RepID=A0A8D8DV59_CULPI
MAACCFWYCCWAKISCFLTRMASLMTSTLTLAAAASSSTVCPIKSTPSTTVVPLPMTSCRDGTVTMEFLIVGSWDSLLSIWMTGPVDIRETDSGIAWNAGTFCTWIEESL